MVPCPGSRQPEFDALLVECQWPRWRTIVVCTAADPFPGAEICVDDPRTLFGEWINAALDLIAHYPHPNGPYEVAVVGSSVKGAPGAIDKLAAALRAHDLTMIGPDFHGRCTPGEVLNLGGIGAHRDDYWRVDSHAFMIVGELGLRCDPQFRWWYSDDDLEMQARTHGPVGVLGGTGMAHTTLHGLTEQQAVWAVEDRTRFETKWRV